MKQSPRASKTPVSLSGSVHERLSAYALAVTAAGVGLTSVQPAQAKIVYTPLHQTLTNGYLDIPVGGAHFELFDLLFTSTANEPSDQFLRFDASDGASSVLGPGYLAAALRAGRVIGPKDNFHPGPAFMASVECPSGIPKTRFPFANTTHRYLGLRFKLKGKIHYGWVRFSSVTASCPYAIVATLAGYAYETIPGKSIVAGKTEGPEDIVAEPDAATPPTPNVATLGLLAMGSRGLSIWRREESIETTL